MNRTKLSVRGLPIAVFVLLLAGCATSSMGPGNNAGGQQASPAQAAANAAIHDNYDEASRLYQRAAQQATAPDAKQHYRFEAGLAAAQAGDADTARQLLADIDPSTISGVDHARYNLARREIAIADLSPGDALSHLPPPARDTAPSVAERVWEKRAKLQFANNDVVAGINALVQRDAWLNNDAAMRANDNRIYEKAGDAIGLGIGPNSADAASASAAVRGWLALAEIGQTQYSGTQARDRAIAQWQQRYPGHPANRTVLADQFDYSSSMSVQSSTNRAGVPVGNNATGPISAPNAQVALALPMTGPFQNAAQAIRDGFVFAYQNDNQGLPQPIYYDSTHMNAAEIAQQVDQDNVGVLAGPLDKSKVAAMANQSLSIPEIALNTIDQPVQRAAFYQFGLDPADEAASAARHAIAQNHHDALALVPSGSWGDRVLAGFRKTLQGDGGQLVASRTYNDSSHDHSQAIQSLLGGGNENAADFIFVAAQPTQARLIRSQLKYYNAGDMPMVTTSQSFSGQADPDSDIDLNGVYFVDMPWLLGSGGTIERLRSEAASTYGDTATAYARLFAMGMDAWVLARRVAQGNLNTDQPLEGMTGMLKAQPDGHITRYLGWAVFRNGRPQTLEMPTSQQALNARNDNTNTRDTVSSSPSANDNTNHNVSSYGSGSRAAN